MQITTDKEKILKALSQAGRFTSSRVGATAGLQGVLFINNKEGLHAYSTNLSTFFHTILRSDTGEEARFLVDPHKVTEFVALLNEGDVTLIVEKDRILISQKKTKGTFSLLPNTDFPTPPLTEGRGRR